jgi:predicted nucleic acid-binding protein
VTLSLRRRLAVGFLGLLVVLSVWWRHVADARQTRALWATLGTGSFSMELLWDLSEAHPSVKREILAATLRQEFDLYPNHIVNAAVGLHPGGLALLLDVFRSECGAPSLRTEKSRTACVELSAALPSRLRGGYLVQALAASSDVAEIQGLARSLGAGGSDDTLARRHISRLLATSPPKSALPLIGALDALGAELSRREADRALDILSSTEGRLDPELLRRVRQRAGPAAVARARARVLAGLREPSSTSIVDKVRGLQALGQELPAADASVIASNVLARYRVEIAREPRQALVRIYVLLSTFEILQRDVPAEILEDAARGFAARTGRHGCEEGAEHEGTVDPRGESRTWRRRRSISVPQPVLAEIAYGIERLPASKRKESLQQRFDLIRFERGAVLKAMSRCRAVPAARAWRPKLWKQPRAAPIRPRSRRRGA